MEEPGTNGWLVVWSHAAFYMALFAAAMVSIPKPALSVVVALFAIGLVALVFSVYGLKPFLTQLSSWFPVIAVVVLAVWSKQSAGEQL